MPDLVVERPAVGHERSLVLVPRLAKERADESVVQFVPKTTSEVRGAEEILTNTVVIHFYPNSWEISKKITKDQDGKTIETDYDPRA